MASGSLKKRQLRRILVAQVPADFADWLDYVAIGALLAFTWQAEPIVFAFLAVALGLPYLIVGPFAGVFVDRSDIRRVMIGSNLGRAGATASLALAPDWPTLLALVFLRSSVDAFFTPAKQAAIQATTLPEGRMSANGISHAINQASKIVAPSVGGALLIVLSPSDVFLLNAVVSLIAVALLAGIASIVREGPAQAEKREPVFRALRDGWSEIVAKRTLRGAVLLMAAGFFAMFFYDTLIAVLLREFGFDGTDLGWTLAAVGAGGVLGALVFGVSKNLPKPFLLIALGSLLGGLLIGGIGLAEVIDRSPSLPILLALFFVIGVASAMSVVPLRTVMQLETPPDRMARVTALSEGLSTFALLTAPFIGAAIANLTSVGGAFIAGGALLLVMAVSAVVFDRRL